MDSFEQLERDLEDAAEKGERHAQSTLPGLLNRWLQLTGFDDQHVARWFETDVPTVVAWRSNVLQPDHAVSVLEMLLEHVREDCV